MEPTDPVICRICGADCAIRINRNGFFQRNVLGHLGIYPWKCGACGSVFLFRRRGHRTRSSKRASESQNESTQI
jgi:hypothetical protein